MNETNEHERDGAMMSIFYDILFHVIRSVKIVPDKRLAVSDRHLTST